MNMAHRWFLLLLVLTIVALAPACSGHSGADSALRLGNAGLTGVPAIPDSEPAGSVNKGTSSYTFVQADLYADSGAVMTGSQLTISDPTGSGLPCNYAILGVDTGGQYPPSLTLSGTLSGLYVGVSDYSRGTWKWLGGAHGAPGMISLPAAGTLSGGGSIYIALVCPPGASADITVDLDITQASDTWNLLVWIAGDNNLAQDAVDNLNDMESVGSNDKVCILAGYDIDSKQISGGGSISGIDKVHFIKVVKDTNANSINTTGDSNNETFSRSGYNSSDPVKLLEFIDWAEQHFPATRTALVLWDHGDGWLPGWKGTSSVRNWQAGRSTSGVLSDDTNGDLTSLTDNAYIVQTLSGKHFDLLCFDACNMGHIEALYDFRSLADWISASEALMPGEGYPYGAILTAWNSATTPTAETVAHIFADETFNYYNNNEDACQATINTAALDPLTTACAALAAEVISKSGAEAANVRQAITNSVRPSLSDGEADLGGFLAAYRSLTTDTVIQEKLDTALSTYDAAANHFRQYKYDGATGITAYLPETADFTQDYQDMYATTAFNAATNWLAMLQAIVAPPVHWVPGDKIEISWDSSNADMDLALFDPNMNYGGPWAPTHLIYCMDFSADNPKGGGTFEWARLKTGAPTGNYYIDIGFNDFSGAPPDSVDVTVKLYDESDALIQVLGVYAVPYYEAVNCAVLQNP
jgi:hypothetical protein